MGGRISFQLKPTEQFLVRSKDSLSEYVTRCSECSRTPSAAAACVSMFLKPFQTLAELRFSDKASELISIQVNRIFGARTR
ncbi:hypothetical protein QL285_010193 [Trifolium repens]|nr:hypothetical protein QL285_010193 [Trifolium repens]